MTKTVAIEIYDELRRERDRLAKQNAWLKYIAQVKADEAAAAQRQSHRAANRSSWNAIDGTRM